MASTHDKSKICFGAHVSKDTESSIMALLIIMVLITSYVVSKHMGVFGNESREQSKAWHVGASIGITGVAIAALLWSKTCGGGSLKDAALNIPHLPGDVMRELKKDIHALHHHQ
jgi:hypothetical protein